MFDIVHKLFDFVHQQLLVPSKTLIYSDFQDWHTRWGNFHLAGIVSLNNKKISGTRQKTGMRLPLRRTLVLQMKIEHLISHKATKEQ